MNVSHQIPPDQLDMLFELLDRGATHFSCPWVWLDSDEFWTEAMTFPLDESRRLRISSEWGDTPNEYVDFHTIAITVDARNEAAESDVPCLIQFGDRARQPMVSISVREFVQIAGDDSVRYDKVILFEWASGVVHAVFADGMAGWIRATTSREIVEKLISKTVERVRRERSPAT